MDCYWSCRLYHFAIIGSCVSLVQGGIAFLDSMKECSIRVLEMLGWNGRWG